MAPSAVEREQVQPVELQQSIPSQKTGISNGIAMNNASTTRGANSTHPESHQQNAMANGLQKIPQLRISEDYRVSEQPVGTIRPMRIICIGAGASGVNLAYQVQSSLQKTDLVLYEKSPAVGGTWYENRYPGCKCDIR